MANQFDNKNFSGGSPFNRNRKDGFSPNGETTPNTNREGKTLYGHFKSGVKGLLNHVKDGVLSDVKVLKNAGTSLVDAAKRNALKGKK